MRMLALWCPRRPLHPSSYVICFLGCRVCLQSLKATLRGARAVSAASPLSPVLNLVTARAMLPALVVTFASLGLIKVRYDYTR